MKKQLDDRLILICDCNNLEHQTQFWYDEEDNTIYVNTHLVTHRGFFKRLWYGLKYAFGYKSRFGAFDDVLLSKESQDKLKAFLNNTTGSPECVCECVYYNEFNNVVQCHRCGDVKEVGRIIKHMDDFVPPFRVGRKQKRAVLDGKSREVVIFPQGREKQAQYYCDFLNQDLGSKANELVFDSELWKDYEKDGKSPEKSGLYLCYTYRKGSGKPYHTFEVKRAHKSIRNQTYFTGSKTLKYFDLDLLKHGFSLTVKNIDNGDK